MKRTLFLLTVVSMLVGCACGSKAQKQSSYTGREDIPAKSEDPASKIRASAVETLTIGSNNLVLEASLWRDFMPMIGSVNGRPLISVNRLVDVNSIEIPDNIGLVKQYVINGDLIWEAAYEEQSAPEMPGNIIERVSRGGPEWETGISVDVIAEIYDSATRKTHYIKLENARIDRVE